MKRAYVTILLSLVFVSFGSGALFAQEESSSPVVSAATVYVQKVYPHSQGYKVVYTKSDLYPAETYLPTRWFNDAGGKGEIFFTSHPSAPYMTVYYVDGQFSHLKLFVRQRYHSSWGALPGDEDLTEQFSIETLALEY